MEARQLRIKTRCAIAGAAFLAGLLPLAGASAHHDPQDAVAIDQPQAGGTEASGLDVLRQRLETRRDRPHMHAAMKRSDALRAAMPSDAYDDDDDDEDETGGLPSRLELVSRGRRLGPDATTDVWTLGRFAYTGTFDSPCGGEAGAGVHVWKVRDERDSTLIGVIDSPIGSRSNDVKVARMNSGDILVHSNESCAGGPGGFEIYNVDDPRNPVLLASVQTDDVNAFLRNALGFVDFGVHNLWLFTQGDFDYVAAVVESEFGNFQIFDITIPSAPVLVGFWGAEELRMVELGLDPATVPDLGAAEFGTILALDDWLFDGFGASTNRFLHDITISEDGTAAYLSNWDAGLVLLDISDPTDPQLVSVALDVANGSLDGEVNSHAAWPSEDGTIVVETEEDFNAFNLVFTVEGLGEFPALEGAFTSPIAGLPGREMAGQTAFVGTACTGADPVPAAAPGAGQIALIDGPGCRFDEKATNVIAAGYAGMIVFNILANGDALLIMGGNPRDIPGIFVGHFTALAIMGVADVGDLMIGDVGPNVSATAVPESWGGVRIWDYSDPANPLLASTFDTTCSADAGAPVCDIGGTYSVHNVIVETVGEDGDDDEDDEDRRVTAYISWYWDGVLVLDVTDPYNPVEIARFSDTSQAFEDQNGGHQDFWGIYKAPGRSNIYASDRNGGLYVFEEEENDDDDDDEGFQVAEGKDG